MERKPEFLPVHRHSCAPAPTRRRGKLAIAARGHGRLEPCLAAAIAHGQLKVHFQAQFEVESGRGCGVEALARWSGPLGREIPPIVFIPMAERLGLIGGVGTWVLRRACEIASTWTFPVQPQPSLSVNVSSLQIDVAFCDSVAKILQDTGFPGERLELEITESALITNMEYVIDCLWFWRALGVRVAIDDFGTGYCGFGYLSRLPINRLKLDKSFVHRMLYDRKTLAIVRSIFALGRDIGVAVLAEGIESEPQMEALETMGCRQVQGFLFAKPVPADEARAHLAKAWGGARRGPPAHALPYDVRESLAS